MRLTVLAFLIHLCSLLRYIYSPPYVVTCNELSHCQRFRLFRHVDEQGYITPHTPHDWLLGGS
jgi:hypothetical protein